MRLQEVLLRKNPPQFLLHKNKRPYSSPYSVFIKRLIGIVSRNFLPLFFAQNTLPGPIVNRLVLLSRIE